MSDVDTAIKDFKSWYERKHGVPYPGADGEKIYDVAARLMDSVAEYLGEKETLREKQHGA